MRFHCYTNAEMYSGQLLYNSGMAKVQFNCRIPEEISLLIGGECERLTAETGKKVSQADVVSMAIVKWCDPRSSLAEDTLRMAEAQGRVLPQSRRAVAEAAMQAVETRLAEIPPTSAPKVNPRAESVAERRAREAKEHAAALAESDTLAKLTGRDDIEYDLENVVHRSAHEIALNAVSKVDRRHYEVQPRKVKPIARPHGSTEAKRRREQ